MRSSQTRDQTPVSCTGRQIFFFFYCSGFCHTLKWNSHGFTCVPHPDPPSHLPLHPIPLGLPRAGRFFTTEPSALKSHHAQTFELNSELCWSSILFYLMPHLPSTLTTALVENHWCSVKWIRDFNEWEGVKGNLRHELWETALDISAYSVGRWSYNDNSMNELAVSLC